MVANTLPQPQFFSPVEAWERVCALLRREIGDNNFRSWIRPLALKGCAGGVLHLAAPTRFMRDWIRAHYADRIRVLWDQHCGPVARVEVAVGAAACPAEFPAAPPAHEVANDEDAAEREGGGLSSPLDPRFTFDTYVSAPCNELAFGAARKVAESAAAVFNPLYIHGSAGLGKTHLLQAVAACVRARRPGARVVYMSAEKFMYRFVQALRGRDTMAFKTAFRAADILLVDDIQFICGKESTQEEFFHALNALLDAGRQVVLSADRPPSDLAGISERLRSRLGWGLVAQVLPPDEAARLEILKAKCALIGRDVPGEVLSFLAEKITSSVRELEGALNRLVAHAEMTGAAPARDSAADLLQDLLCGAGRTVCVEDIQKKTCTYYGIRMADMLSPRRARLVARPRQVAMYLSKQMTAHSLPDIGRRFGGRDHTTIMHGVRKIESLMETDRQLTADVAAIRRMLVE